MIRIGYGRNDWKVSAHSADLRRSPQSEQTATVEAAPQSVTLDMSRTAVIVVDMQNDFCSPGGWLDFIGADYAPLREPVERQNRFLSQMRRESIPVIWLNWGNRPDRLNLSPSVLHVYNGTGAGIGIGETLPGNSSKVLEKGSWGAEILEELEVGPEDIRVDKYRMSGFVDTPLDSILRNLRVDTILFAGVNLDQCVMATLQDAVNAGYDALLLKDLCATNSPGYCIEATYYNVKQCYGFLTDSEAVLRALETTISCS
ncbi:cysteine hydrolase family protein [Paenibacillus sp. OV219]|uniref:cysteine hydrolase family protein n=1 Tax=Paenibacillus sp. OV219 TaxID=1884377 RepID=UPI0008D796FC|nr:cysteine hydrolase family protein [Paenibacillus sp. OV219]SEO76547.1 Nicotinamidase-related amidase [Paenibacillus sp. OV219]